MQHIVFDSNTPMCKTHLRRGCETQNECGYRNGRWMQRGKKGFDPILKRASQISLTWDCILMKSVKLSSMDKPPRFLFFDIMLSYYSHSPVFFLFSFFLYHCFGTALAFVPADSTNICTRILPRPLTSVHTQHRALQNLWFPLQNPPWNIFTFCAASSVFCI